MISLEEFKKEVALRSSTRPTQSTLCYICEASHMNTYLCDECWNSSDFYKLYRAEDYVAGSSKEVVYKVIVEVLAAKFAEQFVDLLEEELTIK